MYTKHNAGEAWVTDTEIIVTWEGMSATAQQEAFSPLRVQLSDVERLDLQGTREDPKYLRIVARGLHPARKVDHDPAVLRFLPIRSAAVMHTIQFVRAIEDAVAAVHGSSKLRIVRRVKDLGEEAAESAERSERGAPSEWRFQVPPNWPAAPAGWTPPAGWSADPAWGPAPDGWQFWVPVGSSHQAPAATPVPAVQPESVTPSDRRDSEVPERAPGFSPPEQSPEDVIVRAAGRFNAKPQLEELASLCRELRAERDRARNQLAELGALSITELESRAITLERQVREVEDELRAQRQSLAEEMARHQQELALVQAQVVSTEDTRILQEVGIYEYSHPLEDSIQYKTALATLKDQIRSMNRADGGAVQGTTNWSVNGSATEGRKMVREFSKLMLRAYNNEADSLVRQMKPYRLQSARDRLEKSRATIQKLGRTMDIRISETYHGLRLHELELTSDHLAKVAEEKEREREEKARLREERQAQLEFEREKERLVKEQRHYENALAALRAKGDEDAAARLEGELERIGLAIADVDYRAANIRAGYVYVISNLGSFGEEMVKVGLTRRLEPRDRVRELSDASVPFNFDIHALHFSEDAVSVEAELHRRLADRRVNLVNRRREFFYATPEHVRELLMDVVGDLLEYTETPEALEFHQSQNERSASPVEGSVTP